VVTSINYSGGNNAGQQSSPKLFSPVRMFMPREELINRGAKMGTVKSSGEIDSDGKLILREPFQLSTRQESGGRAVIKSFASPSEARMMMTGSPATSATSIVQEFGSAAKIAINVSWRRSGHRLLLDPGERSLLPNDPSMAPPD